MKSKRTGNLFALMVCAALAASCASFGPIDTIYPKNLSTERIHEELSARSTAIDTLWARMKMIVSGEGIKGKQFFYATVLFKEPDKIRVRGDRLHRTLFEILVRGENIGVYFNRDKVLYLGTMDDLRESTARMLLSRPTEMIHALIVCSIFVERMDAGLLKDIRQIPGHYLMEFEEPHRITTFSVRNSDLLIDRVRIFKPNGVQTAEIEYTRYEDFDGAVMPSDLEMRTMDANQTVRAKVSEYKLNPELQPEVFAFGNIIVKRKLPLNMLFKEPKQVTE